MNPDGDLDPKRCPARSRQTGRQCGNVAGKGTRWLGVEGVHCTNHGAASPSYVRRGERLAAEQEARQIMEARGYGSLRANVSPSEFLLGEVARCAGNISFVEEMLQQYRLDPGALVSGRRYERTRSDGQGTTETTTETGPLLAVWVDLYHRERAAGVRASEAALRAGVEERQLQLAEEQGELMGKMLRAVIGVLPEHARPAAYEAARGQIMLMRSV